MNQNTKKRNVFAILLSTTLASSLSAQSALVITEFVYDVCNAAPLNDGNGGSNGEYVIITNTGSTAVDVGGWELDDDNDFGDNDGMVLADGTVINANSVLIFAGTDQTSWEAEYNIVIAGATFVNVNDLNLSWQALNNTGDNIGFGNTDVDPTFVALNNGSYSDITTDGEVVIYDFDTGDWTNPGHVSLSCNNGVQDYIPGTTSVAAAGIPEPSTSLLSLIGLACVTLRRKR